jgi:very-short-patch-repair endonuclease
MSIPKAGSPGEEAFLLHCRAEGITTVMREFRFCDRKWRFDFAIPSHKIAIEIEGGLYIGGGHSRGKGYEANLEKYNTAVKMGWRVLRYSTDMVMAGTAVDDVLKMMAS